MSKEFETNKLEYEGVVDVIMLGRMVVLISVDNVETTVDVLSVLVSNCNDSAVIVIRVELIGSSTFMSEVDTILLEVECIDEIILDSDAVVAGFVTTTSTGEVSNGFLIEYETDSMVLSKFIDVEALVSELLAAGLADVNESTMETVVEDNIDVPTND